jgi:hypothetical protein
VLIDGKGHHYVDGREGTNASQASASIIRCGEREGYFFWTSDATPAYQLVIPDVSSVTRTVVALTNFPAVVVVDKVIKQNTPSTIQARFYALNSDGKGNVAAAKEGFTVTRPYARLAGSAASAAAVQYVSAIPDIPPTLAQLHPYADVVTEKPAKEICLVTVLLMTPAGVPGGTAQVSRDGVTYTARMSAASRSALVKVVDSGAVPEFEVEKAAR